MNLVNNELCREILSKSNFGFILFDTNFKLLAINPFIEKISAYTIEELQKNDFFEIFFPAHSYRISIEEQIKNKAKYPITELEIKFQTKDKKILYTQVAINEINIKDKTYILLSLSDLTLRYAYEQVIESSYDNIVQKTLGFDEALKKIEEQRAILHNYKIKMTKELIIAKSIQKAITPQSSPTYETHDIHGKSISSGEIGGDYYDYFKLHEESLGILIADVSGHGVPSALITTMLKAHFENFSKNELNPSNVLFHVNNALTSVFMDSGFYLTAIYAVLNMEKNEMVICNAGHCNYIVYSHKNNEVHLRGEEKNGSIIGVFEDAEFESEKLNLDPEDIVLFYTDGIIEARNNKGDFFGNKLLEKRLLEMKHASAKDIVEKVFMDTDNFYNNTSPNDDRTIIAIRSLHV